MFELSHVLHLPESDLLNLFLIKLSDFPPIRTALQPVELCYQAVRHSEPDLHCALHCGDDT